MNGIIGLGNPLKGDDGIGILLVKEIEEKSIPSNVRVFDAGTGGMKILHLLSDLEKVIIVDAIHFGGKPGESVFFEPDEVNSLSQSKSTHDTNFLDVLKISQRLEEEPEEVVIMGIEPKDVSLNESLSPELERKKPDLTEKLYERVKDMFGTQ